MTVAAFVLAILKAIPATQKIFEQVIDLYYASQSAADHTRYAKKKAHRDAIIAAMKRPEVTDDELKDLRRALYDLNRG
jgi:hypothetical protein